MQPPVITIDGPSGSGKGEISARLARELGFALLDSGALYRTLGLAASRAGVALDDPDGLARIAGSMRLEFGHAGPGSVHLDGDDVSLAIRTDEGSLMASRVGEVAAARDALHQRQLQFRQPPGLVADGRDMGTVVFPDAEVKIFLTASAEERAKRRHKQLIGKGIDAILPDLLRDLLERDERDSQRAVSPLKPAADAKVLDTTELSIEQVMEQVYDLVQQKLGEKVFRNT